MIPVAATGVPAAGRIFPAVTRLDGPCLRAAGPVGRS